MARYKDFDEALDEAFEPISFKLNGKTYTLEEEPNAAEILRLMRDGLDNPEAQLALITEVLGHENVDEIIGSGDKISYRKLNAVTEWIINQALEANPDDDDDDGEGSGDARPPS